MSTLRLGFGVIPVGLLTLALPACGQRALETGGPGHDNGGAGDAGSPGTAGVAGTMGAAGGAAASAPVEPPADVSGRWGMFGFEDPVGVLLKEAPDGTLTGRGCAAGAPGSKDDSMLIPQFCGDISGKVIGHIARFRFPFTGPPRVYSAEVTVSSDGSRMAGTLDNGADGRFLTAWLRVTSDDRPWLTQGPLEENDALAGSYDLALIPEASMGGEFTAAGTYLLTYYRAGMSGDLGSFYWTEVSDPSQGSPLRAGPVPATQSSLPTSLTADFDGSGLMRVLARTPSGGLYTFAASKRP